MNTSDEKTRELNEEIQLIRLNLQILRRAKKNCSCGCYGTRPHYHKLIAHDSESGDEYHERSEWRHQRFVERLRRDLGRLKGRLRKLEGRKRMDAFRENSGRAETTEVQR